MHISLIGSSKLFVGVSVDSWPSVLAHDEVATYPGSTRPSPSDRLHHSGNPECGRRSDTKLTNGYATNFQTNPEILHRPHGHITFYLNSCPMRRDMMTVWERLCDTSLKICLLCLIYTRDRVLLAWCSEQNSLVDDALFPCPHIAAHANRGL